MAVDILFPSVCVSEEGAKGSKQYDRAQRSDFNTKKKFIYSIKVSLFAYRGKNITR